MVWSTIVIGGQYINPSYATIYSVRLTNTTVGSHAISISESILLHRLCLESATSTLSNDHISDALVTNRTSSPVHLQDDVALGTYEVIDLSSIEESLPLPIAGVSAQTLDVTNFADVTVLLMPHFNVLDYPDAKPALLKLMAQCREAIALQVEPLGVTT